MHTKIGTVAQALDDTIPIIFLSARKKDLFKYLLSKGHFGDNPVTALVPKVLI